MRTILNLSIFPTDKGASVSQYVARVIRIIEDSGLPFQTGPMSTSIEGDWDDVITTLSACYKELEKFSDRIYIQAAFDCRKGPAGRMETKISSLEQHLQKNRAVP